MTMSLCSFTPALAASRGLSRPKQSARSSSAFFGRSARLLQPARPVARRGPVAAMAVSWESMSGYMKKRCQEAADLEAKDKEAGRAAWVALDKECPGARMAFEDGAGERGSNKEMDKFCDGNPSAEECKVFDD